MVPQRVANSRRTLGLCLSLRLQTLAQRTRFGIWGLLTLSGLA
jgi:hypothetical protein